MEGILERIGLSRFKSIKKKPIMHDKVVLPVCVTCNKEFVQGFHAESGLDYCFVHAQMHIAFQELIRMKGVQEHSL